MCKCGTTLAELDWLIAQLVEKVPCHFDETTVGVELSRNEENELIAEVHAGVCACGGSPVYVASSMVYNGTFKVMQLSAKKN